MNLECDFKSYQLISAYLLLLAILLFRFHSTGCVLIKNIENFHFYSHTSRQLTSNSYVNC